jgi:hypothetical protein
MQSPNALAEFLAEPMGHPAANPTEANRPGLDILFVITVTVGLTASRCSFGPHILSGLSYRLALGKADGRGIRLRHY